MLLLRKLLEIWLECREENIMNEQFVEMHKIGVKKGKIDTDGKIQIPYEYLTDIGLQAGDNVSIGKVIVDGECALLIKKKKRHYTDIDNLEKLELNGITFKMGENVKIVYNHPNNKLCEYFGKIEKFLKTKWETDCSISYYVILDTLDKQLLIDRIKEIERI